MAPGPLKTMPAGDLVALHTNPTSKLVMQVEFLSQHSWLARNATALGVHFSNTLVTDQEPAGVDLVRGRRHWGLGLPEYPVLSKPDSWHSRVHAKPLFLTLLRCVVAPCSPSHQVSSLSSALVNKGSHTLRWLWSRQQRSLCR